MVSISYIYMGLAVPASVLIPITIGVYRFKELNKEMKTIFYYLLLNAVVNVTAIYIASFKINNLPILHVFTILEFLMIAQFYLYILKDRIVRRFIRVLMIIFPVLCIVNFVFFQSILQFNTNTRPLEALFVMMMSLSYFAQSNNYDEDEKWVNNPVNWVSTALLLYFSGALFIFSFSNLTSVVRDPKYYSLTILIWNIHATLVLFMYLLFAKGLGKCRRA